MVPGGIVRSKAGRDKGREFIVVKAPEGKFVLISDGSMRRMDNPKRKNIRHLEYDGTIVGILNEKFDNNAKVTNADIRKALSLYKENRDMKDGNDAEG
jgi:large subunit ribosomal protein L14e